MTVERAVSLLGSQEEDELLCAAAHLQTQCFRGAHARTSVRPVCSWPEETVLLACEPSGPSLPQVYSLGGLEKLLPLLCSDSESVRRVAAGALRNLVYQSDRNKMEVEEKGGLGAVLQALRSSRDVETRRELTGALAFPLLGPLALAVANSPSLLPQVCCGTCRHMTF